MANVVVTGGAGFIGSRLARELLARKHKVTVVDDLSLGDRRAVPEGARFVSADIRDFPRMAEIFSGAQYVFHLAALPRIQRSVADPLETDDVNVNGTVSVLEAARANRVKRVIFASSSSVYGDQSAYPLKEEMVPHPLSPYALQKFVGEEYCRLYSRLYGLSTVCLRYFSVYGETQNGGEQFATVIGRFLFLKRQGKALSVNGDGNKTRDFTYLDDVVRATIAAMTAGGVGKGEAVNVCSGKEISIRQVAEMVGGRIKHLKECSGESERIWGDNSTAERILSWRPETALSVYLNRVK